MSSQNTESRTVQVEQAAGTAQAAETLLAAEAAQAAQATNTAQAVEAAETATAGSTGVAGASAVAATAQAGATPAVSESRSDGSGTGAAAAQTASPKPPAKKDHSKLVRGILIAIAVAFVLIMLVLPLVSVITNSLKEGFAFYIESLQTKYVLSALSVTLIAAGITLLVNTIFGLAASWVLTRYSFKGKQVLSTLIDIPFSISPVIAGLAFVMMFGRMGWATPILDAINDFFGTDIQIAFAIPGVVLATIFVTFPFVSREIIPVLNSRGTDEETAAAQMGAKGFTIFRKITFPQIKWALLYGMVLCAARALGEFGAVNAISKTRGETFTLPLEIDALYMSGASDSITAAFAVSSILVIIAIIMLVLRTVFETKSKKKDR